MTDHPTGKSIPMEALFNLVEKYWYQKTGLFAAIILVISIELTALIGLKVSPSVSLTWIVVSLVATTGIWLWSRALPKAKADKVGFVVSIASDDDAEAKRFRHDFILTLRRLIMAGHASNRFQFIEIRRHHADKIIDLDDAQRLRIATNGHFVLSGRVRLRELNNRDHHFIELDGVVAHKPIPNQVSQQLQREFSELLPRKVIIARENDLLAFQFASEWAEIVAKYIIGIAAALSGDLDYAEQLYRDVEARIGTVPNRFPIFKKLQERLPTRFLEIKEARGRAEYEQWVLNHDPVCIDRLGRVLDTIDNHQNNASVLSLHAIFCFLRHRQVNQALQFLNQTPKPFRNATWHLNVAFLYAYQGNLKKAARHYKTAVTLPLEPDLIRKVEGFLRFMSEQERDKPQLHYCLGYFYWKIKGDQAHAITELSAFLAGGNQTQFQLERELAGKWIAELRDNSR
jgi:tetratricopeptide (TPR) repeat protein